MTAQPTSRSQSKYEKLRKLEIDRNNKVLLGNMLRIEKDLHSIKQKLKTQTNPVDMLGIKAER